MYLFDKQNSFALILFAKQKTASFEPVLLLFFYGIIKL